MFLPPSKEFDLHQFRLVGIMNIAMRVLGEQMRIEEIPDVGFFSWDIADNILYADSALAELFGIDPNEAEQGLPIEVYLERVHPADRPRLAKVISKSISEHTNQNEKYRVKQTDGNYVDVESFARAFRDRWEIQYATLEPWCFRVLHRS